MKVHLAEFARPSPLEFNLDETGKYIKVLAKRQERNRDCCKELFFGVFFDRTNSNADRDRHARCHSEIARHNQLIRNRQ